MSLSTGGVYVARTHKNIAMIAGISVACAIVLIIIIGTVIYCRKKPEAWDKTKTRMRNVTRSLKTEV